MFTFFRIGLNFLGKLHGLDDSSTREGIFGIRHLLLLDDIVKIILLYVDRICKIVQVSNIFRKVGMRPFATCIENAWLVLWMLQPSRQDGLLVRALFARSSNPIYL